MVEANLRELANALSVATFKQHLTTFRSHNRLTNSYICCYLSSKLRGFWQAKYHNNNNNNNNNNKAHLENVRLEVGR